MIISCPSSEVTACVCTSGVVYNAQEKGDSQECSWNLGLMGTNSGGASTEGEVPQTAHERGGYLLDFYSLFITSHLFMMMTNTIYHTYKVPGPIPGTSQSSSCFSSSYQASHIGLLTDVRLRN